eukprot:1074319-Pelagomonas_calceolata.AAC.2
MAASVLPAPELPAHPFQEVPSPGQDFCILLACACCACATAALPSKEEHVKGSCHTGSYLGPMQLEAEGT